MLLQESVTLADVFGQKIYFILAWKWTWSEMWTREGWSFHGGVSRHCFEPHACHQELQNVHVLNAEGLLAGVEQPSWFWQGRKNTFWDVRGPCAPSLLWIQNSWKHNPDLPRCRQVLYHQKIKSCSVAMRWPLSQMSKLWNIFFRCKIFLRYSGRCRGHKELLEADCFIDWQFVKAPLLSTCTTSHLGGRAGASKALCSPGSKNRGVKVEAWSQTGTHWITHVMNWFQKKIL